MSFQQQSRPLLSAIWMIIGLLTLVMFIGRQGFLWSAGDSSTIFGLWDDYLQSLFIGARFDLRVTTIAFAPLLLIGLALAPFPRLFVWIKRVIPGYSFILFFLSSASVIGNYYYYKTYNNYFDTFIFGLFNDDTDAIIHTIIQDYPVTKATLACLIIAILGYKISAGLLDKAFTKNYALLSKTRYSLYILLSIFILFSLARGSLGTFPLKKYQATVSKYDVLNKVTPNPILALDWALGEHNRQTNFEQVDEAEYHAQMERVLGQNDAIYHTPQNSYLAEHKPNVIFSLMESMGTNFLIEDDPKTNDLLGSMRQHIQSDFYFDRFIASTDGTMTTIASVLFNSNNGTISLGQNSKKHIPGSAFLPFKQAGYKIIYITGGSPTWRNIGAYMPIQGVDEFYQQYHIQKMFPESVKDSNVWGVPDEYLFKFAEHILEQNSGPVFIMTMSQTNHPPYDVPDSYKLAPLTLTDKFANKLTTDSEEATRMLETYQYSSDSLGHFITDIKTSAKGDNTIIAATGDHRMRQVEVDFPEDMGSAYAVPFYFYAPDSLKQHVPHKYNKNRVGSHRDIFPTLYAWSLSDSDYYSLGGENILSDAPTPDHYGVHFQLLFSDKGVIDQRNPEQLFPWANNSGLNVSSTPIANPNPSWPAQYKRLQDLFINQQIAGYQ